MNTSANVMQNSVSLMGNGSGADKGKSNTAPAPAATTTPLDNIQQNDYQKFGNWLGNKNSNTKDFANDLMNRGLKGADQLVNDDSDKSTRNGVVNSQSDWKISAIQQILANARKNNIRTKADLIANRHQLIDNTGWSDAIDNPSFNNIHSNFWDVIGDNLLPQQWKKYDAAHQQNNVASNTN
ncbi:MAG: hypothetical protein ABI091_26720 [Ferruginibacter sp.]